MTSLEKDVSFFLAKLRANEFEEAFHGLSELESDVIPLLVNAFHEENDPSIRSELVRIISEFRSKKAIPFLKDVSTDPNSEVWRCAIDGLVASGDRDALMALKHIKSESELYRSKPIVYVRWIDEACDQLEDRLNI